MSEIELRDMSALAVMSFTLLSLTIFWKLYMFKRPHTTNEEMDLKHKSHRVSNEASQLQSTVKNLRPSGYTLQKLTEAMQESRDRKSNGIH